MQDSHALCRLLRHSWVMYAPDDPRRTSGVWRNALHLKCERCGMTRHDAFDPRGGFLTRRYDPPEGYYMAKGEDKPEVEQLRLWAVKRQRRIGAPVVPDREKRARSAAADAI